MSVSQEDLVQKWVFARLTQEVEGFDAIITFFFTSPMAHRSPLSVLLNFSAFEALENPSSLQTKTKQGDGCFL